MKSSFLPLVVILSSNLLSTLFDSSTITMEKINLGYSTKNIPLPSKSEYMKRLIEKMEQFLQRMRWKAYFLNQQETSTKDTYGFKSKHSPPKINELIPFEEGMVDLIQNIKFKDNMKSSFQQKLDADIKNKIKKPNSLLIPADKTTNYYKMNTSAYNELIKENVTKSYKKSSGKVVEKLNAQSAKNWRTALNN